MLNLRRPVAAFVFLFQVPIFTLVNGCAKKSFAVEVPHGLIGNVYIFCGPTVGFPSKPVQVNSLGGGNADTCPGGDADIKVLRDGVTITATAVNWERNGDGSPIALSFNVK